MNRAAGMVPLIVTIATAAMAQPNIVVTSLPIGMVELIGGAIPTDSFTVSNVGASPGVISALTNGTFFTVSPGSASIASGASQIFTLRGTAQALNAFNGSVTVSGSGTPPNGITIPVRMMVGVAPAGTVNPRGLAPRLDIAGPANQPHIGGVTFNNAGNATMQGIAVADAAWMVPQTDIVSIAASRNAAATFTTDPTRRPDAAAPLGGFASKFSLRFLAGAGGSSTGRLTPLDGPGGGIVSVTVVDVVQPGFVLGSPPPLTAGEIALFIPAIGSRNIVTSDLFLAGQRGSTAVTALQVFYASSFAGSNSFLATIAQPAAGLGLWFPSIVQTIFRNSEQAGTIQLRGAQTRNISISAVQVASPGDGRVFTSPLPVLHSDRGIGPGEAHLLSGVDKSATLSTSLYVQEMSGQTASVQTEFFDSNGLLVGAKRTDSIGPFRVLELLDIAPSGARSIRVTNTSAGAGIGAMALLADNATSASWSIVDLSRNAPSTSDWVVPILAPPIGPAQTDLFITNASSAPQTVTVEPFTPNPPIPPSLPARRRAVHSSNTAPVHVEPLATSTLTPLQTLRTSLQTTNSLIRVAGSAGAISASARTTITSAGSIGSFGASLPIVPVNSALVASAGTRFTGVDDSSNATIASKPSGTFRSSLILAEVAGASATVRVTLHYTFVAGPAISSQALSSRDFALTAGQMLIVADLARTVIGPQRDAFGDLRNMQVDVDVISGSGKVLPFIESIDNGSGDIMVRAE